MSVQTRSDWILLYCARVRLRKWVWSSELSIFHCLAPFAQWPRLSIKVPTTLSWRHLFKSARAWLLLASSHYPFFNTSAMVVIRWVYRAIKVTSRWMRKCMSSMRWARNTMLTISHGVTLWLYPSGKQEEIKSVPVFPVSRASECSSVLHKHAVVQYV